MQINKHIRLKKQIDININELKLLINKTDDKKNIVNSIIYDLINHKKSSKQILSKIIQDKIADLKNYSQQWDILNHGDILGYIYESIQPNDFQKKNGQYFTPINIITNLLKEILPERKEIVSYKILDPASGSGQFLIQIYKHLFATYQNLGYDKNKIPKMILTKNLFGNDIDEIANLIAQKNLSMISDIPVEKIKLFNTNFLYKDELNLGGKERLDKNYNLIIGNPPWGSKLTEEEKRYFYKGYHVAKSGINTFSLFIERATDFLSSQGKIAFIIPDSLLNIKAHSNTREFILQNFRINSIDILGDQFKKVFAPAISIIMSHEKDEAKRNGNKIFFSNSLKKENLIKYIPQQSFNDSYQNIFNINYSSKTKDIIQNIRNNDVSYLKEQSKFILGIVTGNNEKHIKNYYSPEHPDIIIKGKDITKYKIKKVESFFKFDPKTLQQTAPQNLYKTENKILYKFIGERLTFALDKKGFYSLNNVNSFIPFINGFNIESLLSILNSSIIQYYYSNTFFTRKVLQNNLKTIPLTRISKSNQKLLKLLTKKIMESEGKEAEKTHQQIDDIIFHEYNIPDNQATQVMQSFSNK